MQKKTGNAPPEKKIERFSRGRISPMPIEYHWGATLGRSVLLVLQVTSFTSFAG